MAPQMRRLPLHLAWCPVDFESNTGSRWIILNISNINSRALARKLANNRDNQQINRENSAAMYWIQPQLHHKTILGRMIPGRVFIISIQWNQEREKSIE